MTLKRAKKIMERLDLLARYSDRDDCLCREFGSEATREANLTVGGWMVEAGLVSRVDNIGNVRGVKDNGKSQAFMMGSHLDTVIDAGKFDGPLGVLLAIDQAQTIDFNLFPYNFEAVGFSNEEGLRFHHCYLGSHVLSGSFKESWLYTTDRSGINIKQAICDMGGDPDRLNEDVIDTERLAGYLEVHIEQGPVLEQSDLPVGLVSHIVAQHRYIITVTGCAGHAGTVPMSSRQDALAGAAAVILEVERTAARVPDLVATVGFLEIDQAATNVIPGKVVFTLDIRHPQTDKINQTILSIRKFSEDLEKLRGVSFIWDKVFEEKPVNCSTQLSEKLGKAIYASGFNTRVLPSGAGHDASVISEIAPVSMLFVRCKGGISHNPLEEVSVRDVATAIEVCDRFFKSFN